MKQILLLPPFHQSGLSRVNSLAMFGYFVFIAAVAAAEAALVAYAVCVCACVWIYPVCIHFVAFAGFTGLVVTCGRALHPPLPFLFSFFFFQTVFSLH